MTEHEKRKREAEQHLTDELSNQRGNSLVARRKARQRNGGLKQKRNFKTPGKSTWDPWRGRPRRKGDSST